MKNIFLKKRLLLVFALGTFAVLGIDAKASRNPCDSVDVTIFGFKILRKYYGDCSNRVLKDGKWDWFPKSSSYDESVDERSKSY